MGELTYEAKCLVKAKLESKKEEMQAFRKGLNDESVVFQSYGFIQGINYAIDLIDGMLSEDGKDNES